jgi:hypothetical protein
VKRPAAGLPALPLYDAPGPILPIRVHVDRIFRITVCLRPFRAAGPRLDVERVADKLIVHNYGHGGSGRSLSWDRPMSWCARRSRRQTASTARPSPSSAAAHWD